MLKRLDKFNQKSRMAEEEAEETGKKPKFSIVDEEESKALFDELNELGKEDIKKIVKEAHAKGEDIPKEL